MTQVIQGERNKFGNSFTGFSCSNMEFGTVQYSTMQYSTIQFSRVQYSIVQYRTEYECLFRVTRTSEQHT